MGCHGIWYSVKVIPGHSSTGQPCCITEKHITKYHITFLFFNEPRRREDRTQRCVVTSNV